MSAPEETPHRTYIKSNSVILMRFLWVMTTILSVLVVGLCLFVILGRDDVNNYHWDQEEQFYYEILNNKVVIVDYANHEAELCTIPAMIKYGKKNYPVTTIGEHAFTNHKNLKSLVIPDTVTEIAGNDNLKSGAFSGCINLENVDLGQGIVRIGNYAFKNCLKLSAVDFPSSVQFVGNGAFQNCLSMQTVKLNSNSVLGADCFVNCYNVNTLFLADDVRLLDKTRQSLADLSRLTHFKIGAENSVYSLPSVDNDTCLLTTTNTRNDTIILGGYGATVPTGVKLIADWAWGSRAKDQTIYIPSSIKVEANSFCDGSSIYTDGESNPFTEISIPVYIKARKVTFIADEEYKVERDLYYDEKNPDYPVRPSFFDVFPDYESKTPFKDWDMSHIDDGIITAIFFGTDKTSNFSSFEATVLMAEEYIKNEDIRLQFTLGFWENFKTIYEQANSILKESEDNQEYEEYEYIVTELDQLLKNIIMQINNETVTPEIWESEDWRVGLQNLLDAINQLDYADLDDTASNREIWDALQKKVVTAEIIIPIEEFQEDDTGRYVWKSTRALYESLTVNMSEDSQLNNEIAACEELNQNDYTKASWQELQEQLILAEQIQASNLSVSQVRMKLEEAVANLSEDALSDELVRLSAWLSICHDLPKLDYQSNEYDRLQIEASRVNSIISTLNSSAKIQTTIDDLLEYYDKLVRMDNHTQFRYVSTGIINKKSMPYFIAAALLFSGAVACGANATLLHKKIYQNKE